MSHPENPLGGGVPHSPDIPTGNTVLSEDYHCSYLTNAGGWPGIYRMEPLAFLFTLEQPHAGSLGKSEENGPKWMLAFPVCLRW